MHALALTNAGLLILRTFLGSLLAAHGALKFLQGGGLDAEVGLLEKDGMRGGRPAAAFSALTQVGSGALLAFGLITPLAGAGALGAMTVATVAKARNGFWVFGDGAEFPLIFAALAIIVTLTGPGAWSIDRVLHVYPTTWETLAAVAVGVVSGGGTFLLLRQSDPTSARTTSAQAPARGAVPAAADEKEERA